MFELFHDAIKQGMTDFTLYRVPQGWQAGSRWHNSTGWRVNVTKDLETAVKGALSTQRLMPVDDGSDLA